MNSTYVFRRVLGVVSVAMSITLLNSLFRETHTSSLTNAPTESPTSVNACTGQYLSQNCYTKANPASCTDYVTKVGDVHYQCYSISEDHCQHFTGPSWQWPTGTCEDYDASFNSDDLTPSDFITTAAPTSAPTSAPTDDLTNECIMPPSDSLISVDDCSAQSVDYPEMCDYRIEVLELGLTSRFIPCTAAGSSASSGCTQSERKSCLCPSLDGPLPASFDCSDASDDNLRPFCETSRNSADELCALDGNTCVNSGVTCDPSLDPSDYIYAQCSGTILAANCYEHADPSNCANYVDEYQGSYYQCYYIGNNRCQRYTGVASLLPDGSLLPEGTCVPGDLTDLTLTLTLPGSESLSPNNRVEIAMYMITIAAISAYLVYLDRFVLILAALVSSTAGAVSIATYADRTFGGSLSYAHVAAVAYTNVGAVAGCLLLGAVHRLHSTERSDDVPVFTALRRVLTSFTPATPAVAPVRSSFTRSRPQRPPVNAPNIY